MLVLRTRQKEIVDILFRKTKPVRLDDLQKLMGYAHRHGPSRHLAALEASGYIAPRRKGEHRAIMLSEAGRAALAVSKVA